MEVAPLDVRGDPRIGCGTLLPRGYRNGNSAGMLERERAPGLPRPRAPG